MKNHYVTKKMPFIQFIKYFSVICYNGVRISMHNIAKDINYYKWTNGK